MRWTLRMLVVYSIAFFSDYSLTHLLYTDQKPDSKELALLNVISELETTSFNL